MARLSETFALIPDLRERFYHSLPGKESLVSTINEAEISEHVYNSNAIENSTLSLEETEKILLEIDLERFVTTREIFEAKNLARVMQYVEQKASQQNLTHDVLLLLHKMLVGNIDEAIAGRFRLENEWVRVGSYIAPNPIEVPSLITNLLTNYHADTESHIVSKIAQFHLEFEHIHPFCDGNGRIGRVLNNYILLREGYVPINIAFTDRARYYAAFKAYDQSQDIKLMEEIIGRAITKSYHKRLAYLEGKSIITLKDFAKLTASSYSNALNKAVRQTIPAFQEKGVWKIGVDKTT
jgi:Fic family protein